MLEYCKNDVELTLRVFKALSEKMLRLGYSELSCDIEHKIRLVINQQEKNGFWFDTVRAKSFRDELKQLQSDLAKRIRTLFPPEREKVAEYSFRRTKDGSPFASYERHRDKYSDIVVHEDHDPPYYECFELVPFNLASPQQRQRKLLELGWEPTEFTKAGNPKTDEDAVLRYAQELKQQGDPRADLVTALAEWLVVNARRSMLEGDQKKSFGWLGQVKEDSRMHGRVMSCGCTTRRMSHNSPNSANIPSPHKAKYGKEMRSLWGVEPNKGLVLVGYDAAGLETAGLCHYLNNPDATKALLRDKPNDIHTANSRRLTEALGRPVDREWGAKTCVPMDTLMLTRRGWRARDELIIGEEVLGYNQETKLKEWTTLKGITSYHDDVIEIKNSRRCFRATGNHRWFVRQRNTGKRPLKKHYLTDEIRTTDELTTESSIIMNAPFNQEQDTVSSVNGLVGKYDIDYVSRVLAMSHAERVQFVQGFLLADGHINNVGNWCWTQNKGNVAEGLLLATYLVHDGQLHVGERQNPNHKLWTVNLSAKSHITGTKLTKTSLGVQEVWCPTTDLGSWVMRQGEEITITGNCWYAWLYGAYPPKLGQILKGPPSDGDIVIETFFRNVPGLKRLINDVQSEWRSQSGRLSCIDGGSVICPAVNATLNYKIQSAGAILMKLTAVYLDEELRKLGVYYRKVGDIHDEGQVEGHERDLYTDDKGTTRHIIGDLAVGCITRAGRDLGFRVPVGGDYRVGKDWSETH